MQPVNKLSAPCVFPAPTTGEAPAQVPSFSYLLRDRQEKPIPQPPVSKGLTKSETRSDLCALLEGKDHLFSYEQFLNYIDSLQPSDSNLSRSPKPKESDLPPRSPKASTKKNSTSPGIALRTTPFVDG